MRGLKHHNFIFLKTFKEYHKDLIQFLIAIIGDKKHIRLILFYPIKM